MSCEVILKELPEGTMMFQENGRLCVNSRLGLTTIKIILELCVEHAKVTDEELMFEYQLLRDEWKEVGLSKRVRDFLEKYYIFEIRRRGLLVNNNLQVFKRQSELELVKSENFGTVQCDFWQDKNGEILMTREQIGAALEYADPNSAIEVIHRRNRDRLDKFSTTVKLTGVEGSREVTREITVYCSKGIYEICRFSRQPKADAFMDWVWEAVESIRKHGAYMTAETIEQAILNPDTIIKIATALKEEKEKNKALTVINSSLVTSNTIMKPKAEYFDELVNRNLLTNFRETANQLGIKEKEFIKFLMDRKYIYRDRKGKLMPYADKNNGLFELKECYNEKTDWKGTQTLITPKGRETFRLLCIKSA